MLVLPTCAASTTFRFISENLFFVNHNLEVCKMWLKSPLLELNKVAYVIQFVFDIVVASEFRLGIVTLHALYQIVALT